MSTSLQDPKKKRITYDDASDLPTHVGIRMAHKYWNE